jgi:murein DD-endopeptidase MepM/ murein hydrolase activator NlpD
VKVGDEVAAGQVIALSAYSGADGFLTFPWVAPHVHYNVYLNGVLVDPFAADDGESIWTQHNEPVPIQGRGQGDFEPTTFSDDQVAHLLNDINDGQRRRHFHRRFESMKDSTLKGFALLVEANTYPTRFDTPHAGQLLYENEHERSARLHLPFLEEDFDRTAFCDDLGHR